VTSRDEIEHRPPLGVHRVLSQGRGAALIRPDGEIDWWCPNHFEATPLLWSLLDRGGAASRWRDVTTAIWDACPAGPTARAVVRHGASRIETWDGLLTLDGSSLLVRLVRSKQEHALVHELKVGGFGSPWPRWTRSNGRWGTESLSVAAATSVRPTTNGIVLDIDVDAGRWSGFALVALGADHDRAVPDLDVDALVDLLDHAEEAEASVLRRIRVPHHHPSRAADALHVLRALTDRTTGAPVASITTSLPEAPGADRQFDYRYSWLRDSALAVATAALLGQVEASAHYLDFLTTLLDRYGDDVPPLATTAGDAVPAEREVDGVAGWAASRPVRVGNAAATQHQLDGLATIIEAVAVHVQCGGAMTRQAWRIVEHAADQLAAAPFEPTSGIWEFREPRQLVSEELARWIGLDRALRLRRWFRPWRRHPEWVAARRHARERVESAFDETSGLFRQSFDDCEPVPDAYALHACMHGFFRRRDPRRERVVLSTIAALEEGAFLHRYPPGDGDGFVGREGAFLPASWWAVRALAAIVRIREAEDRADSMCSILPPLQAEEWSVERQEPMGNTPLLWSHMESARALYALQSARLRRRYGRVVHAIWLTGRHLRLRAARMRRTGR
jgi:hypothetical protein